MWLPASLIEEDAQESLANALFAGSRYHEIELHFNKGLAPERRPRRSLRRAIRRQIPRC
jgi:hypothetical protein